MFFNKRASLPPLETKWYIRNCQLVYQNYRAHKKTNITWLLCSPDRNQWAKTEVMGFSGAPGRCTHTRCAWQKGSPYFSVRAGLSSLGQLQESWSAAFWAASRTSLLKGWQAVSWGEKCGNMAQNLRLLVFMKHQNTHMMTSNLWFQICPIFHV